jgi:hypothetical protein
MSARVKLLRPGAMPPPMARRASREQRTAPHRAVWVMILVWCTAVLFGNALHFKHCGVISRLVQMHK